MPRIIVSQVWEGAFLEILGSKYDHKTWIEKQKVPVSAKLGGNAWL